MINLGVVVPRYNFRIWEVEARGSQVRAQPETLYHKTRAVAVAQKEGTEFNPRLHTYTKLNNK